MILDNLARKRKSKSWEEVREEIIQAIEEEERLKMSEQQISKFVFKKESLCSGGCQWIRREP